MTDLEKAFCDALTKESTRKKAPGQIPDVGISAQATMTRATSDSKPPTDTLDSLTVKTKSKQPASTWRAPAKLASSIFNQKGVNPIGLTNVLLSKYGKDWVDWEPETLWEMIEKDYGAAPGD